ncbi:MAG: endonuclease/exonuclease/phosphatase family protein [Verrucomicrobiaceae bacterium]|nr:endonuclease/exonuclease/phosphatase family protein [Verrucomicrobiaceae bacterium]
MKRFPTIFSTVLIPLTSILCCACNATPKAENNTQSAPDHSITMRACSFNLRGVMKKDTGVRNWKHRKTIVANFIRKFDIDIIGAQESAVKQFPAFNELLPDYAYFGESSLGKKDGRVINLIIYKKSKYKLLENATLWLAPTPKEKTKILDSAEPRTVNYGKFSDNKTGKIFYVFSTHLDHRGKKAKPEQAKYLMKIIKEKTNGTPYLLVGDFNSGDDSKVIKYIKSQQGVLDARDISKKEPINMPHTFNGFKGHTQKGDKNAKRIDFLFISAPSEVATYEVSDYNENGAYPSDHYPIICDIILK